MAYKQTQEKSKYEYEFKSDYESDWDIHRSYLTNFDAWEAMLTSQVYDSVSKSVEGSKITDSYATTLAKERADRVIAKLPDGETQSIGRADAGKAAFMDILRQKWIYPNANAQRPFLEKLNMWQLYSSVYGYMPMYYDWTTSNTGYVGPDCWLWNPRNLIPQQGKVSIEDMEYVTALVWVTKKKLQDILDKEEDGDGWDRDALVELIERASNQSSGNDSERDSLVSRDRNPAGSKKGICLATRYEAGPNGQWCTFAPDHSFVKIRELANPHKNGRIPFVVKYSQPLFDSFYGLGDFQRAKPLQFARDGLTNFYFASIKRNLAPGIIVNANGVLKHTLDVTKPNPILMETVKDSIRPIPTNAAGLSTYQGAQSNLTGSLLSLFGTQNASIPGAESLNPSQGKTPAAINMYGDKEATRDGAETRHMETAIEQLTDGFFSLVVNIGTENVPVDLFYDDIKDIADSGLSDIEGLFDGKLQLDKSQTAGTLRIDPKSLKGVEYRFNIAPDSTAKINKQQQLTQLDNLMDRLGKFQNIFKDDPRIDVNWGAIMEAAEKLSDLKGAKDFVTVRNAPSPREKELTDQVQKLQEAQQSAQQQPSPTAVQSGTGQVHESADLVKLLTLYPQDQDLKTQILQLMGLRPTPPSPDATPDPTVASTGHAFQDPTIAAAVDALHAPSDNKPPEPTINPAGMFHDPHIGQAAHEVLKLNSKSPAPMAEPAKPGDKQDKAKPAKPVKKGA